MQNHNIIDISDLPQQERLLAIDFLEFLKSKSKKKNNATIGNYDKSKLINAINSAKENNVFNNIDDSVKWQEELRNEWEQSTS